MPLPGKQWRHVIFGTRGSWLPGDPRGWRSRDHKRHSSGDYRVPPPTGEHEGLYHYSLKLCPAAVTLPAACRARMGQVIRAELGCRDHRLLVLAVGGQHVHLLAELPDDSNLARQVVGKCKHASSRAVSETLPGRIWAGGGKYLLVEIPEHHVRAYRYILRHAEQGAWVWNFHGME